MCRKVQRFPLGLATRILTEGGSSTEQRLNFAFSLCVSRAPRPEEVAILSETLKVQAAEFQADPAKAAEFLKIGQAAVPQGLNAAELAAWTAVARVVLNLHEAITRA